MNRIRYLRQQRGLTMMSVAEALGIAYTTYANYDQGTREPNSEMLIALSRFYGVSVDYLIGNTAVPVPPGASSEHTTAADDDPLANALFAAYGEVKEEFDEDDIEDVKMFMRVVAERKRRRAAKKPALTVVPPAEPEPEKEPDYHNMPFAAHGATPEEHTEEQVSAVERFQREVMRRERAEKDKK